MEKVTFVGGTFQNAERYGNPLKQGLDELYKKLNKEDKLRDDIDTKIGTKDPTSILPIYWLRSKPTIDEIVKRQQVNYFLRGKGIVLVHPESGSTLFNPDFSFAFPYNTDPSFSLATLVALDLINEKKFSQRPLFNDVGFVPFEYGSEERALIKTALGYLKATNPSNIDRRPYTETEAYKTAVSFMKAYESLKKSLTTDNKSGFKRLVLLLTFTATYERMRRMAQEPLYFDRSFNFSNEFFEKYPLQEINFAKVEDIPESKGHTNGKCFIEAEDLDKVSTEKLWGLVNTKLDKSKMITK